MKDNGNNQGSHFLTAFLLGAAIGGVVVFLVGTKKGKKLLKVLTEGGLESVSEISDMLANQDEDTFDDEGDIEVEQVEASPVTQSNGHAKKPEAARSSEKSPIRRFFKVKKK